jgi:YVTN family beta-propeller protein
MRTSRLVRAVAAASALMAGCGAALVALSPAAGAAPVSDTAVRAAASGVAAFSPNLLVNPGAQAGAFSARGWDAVTIPGWQITSGLPSVIRYGTPQFPAVTGHAPAVRDAQLFVGGAGGTARLRQVVSLRNANGSLPRAGTRFRLSAWLGGSRRSRASVTASFWSAAGKVIGTAVVGPAGGRKLARRATAGPLPAGAASVRITLVLATSLTNIDGPYAPLTGFNRAIADDIQFSVTARMRRPVLTPPAAHVPRYQHVFLFYFENEDYGAVVGDTRQDPFLNRLLPHASLLSDFFAEEHPSDGNYLALAGGSTFGIPLDDPLEENPQDTIRARNISDLLGAAHETWKAYLQSADGPCDDTVHGYYWDDDMPMTYFADVRDRPAFCAAHVVPLQALQGDLATAATTPNFAWVSPDDCSDMEACGMRAGDEFLASELGAIMRSPAWRTQRSLAIITFDEDATDNEHPAQRVATVIIGSRGVRQGYVSRVRYTHYSLLRTIEAALGLGTLTANDRFAQPVNDIFQRGTAASARPVSVPYAARVGGVRAGPAVPVTPLRGGIRAPAQETAFVTNSASNSVTPIDLVTRKAGRPIRVGADPTAIAVTPDGAAAYVVNSGSGTITPISTATGKAWPAIPVGSNPQDIAITPDGRTAYVTNMGSDSVTPVDLATGAPGVPIAVGPMPRAIAITPDGRTAFVLNWGGASVTPIQLAPNRFPAGPGHFGVPLRPVRVGSYPSAIAIAPDGVTAYVAGYGSDTVTPIDVARLRAGVPVPTGQAPSALAVMPGGSAVYAVNGDSDSVTPIAAGLEARAERSIGVGYSPTAVAIPRAGDVALVVNSISGTVTPISLTTGKKGRPIPIGLYSYPTAIGLGAVGTIAVVVSPYAGQVTLINTATLKAIKTVSVGDYPSSVAIAP